MTGTKLNNTMTTDLFILVSATTTGRNRVDLKVVKALERIDDSNSKSSLIPADKRSLSGGKKSRKDGTLPMSGIDNHKGDNIIHDFKESTNAISSEILKEIGSNLDDWVDELGRESAAAQNLKLPITSAEKLKIKAPGHDSPDKFNDYLYLLIRTSTADDVLGLTIEPIGFIRVGNRSLFLVKPQKINDSRNSIGQGTSSQLVQVDPCFCALDFYCRIRRSGFGHFLFKQALNIHSTKANKVAFDRPTTSMISFLSKHFKLNNPIEQPNHFVIFDTFFDT